MSGSRGGFVAAVALTGTLLGACATAPGPVDGQSRATIEMAPPRPRTVYEEIARVREIARRIVIDGEPEDWVGIHSIEDPGEEDIADGAVDIVSLAIAPREEDILVMCRLRDPPYREGARYSVTLDILGDTDPECDVMLLPGGAHAVYLYDEEGTHKAVIETRDVEVAVGSVLEVRIPHGTIGSLLATGGRPAELPLRPWIRARAYSWRGPGTDLGIVDNGPRVASYRLLDHRFELDSPVAVCRWGQRAIDCPVRGLQTS